MIHHIYFKYMDAEVPFWLLKNCVDYGMRRCRLTWVVDFKHEEDATAFKLRFKL